MQKILCWALQSPRFFPTFRLVLCLLLLKTETFFCLWKVQEHFDDRNFDTCYYECTCFCFSNIITISINSVFKKKGFDSVQHLLANTELWRTPRERFFPPWLWETEIMKKRQVYLWRPLWSKDGFFILEVLQNFLVEIISVQTSAIVIFYDFFFLKDKNTFPSQAEASSGDYANLIRRQTSLFYWLLTYQLVLELCSSLWLFPWEPWVSYLAYNTG